MYMYKNRLILLFFISIFYAISLSHASPDDEKSKCPAQWSKILHYIQDFILENPEYRYTFFVGEDGKLFNCFDIDVYNNWWSIKELTLPQIMEIMKEENQERGGDESDVFCKFLKSSYNDLYDAYIMSLPYDKKYVSDEDCIKLTLRKNSEQQ